MQILYRVNFLFNVSDPDIKIEFKNYKHCMQLIWTR